MSTRSFIGFYGNYDGIYTTNGVYHHSDGYPSGVGNKLYQLAQVYADLTFLKEILLDHPSGYICILDWSGAPEDLIGYDEYEAILDALKPTYADYWEAYEARSNMGLGKYYDGERADPNDKLINITKVMDSWMEYAYVVYPEYRMMVVFKVGIIELIKIGVVDFDAPIPEFLKD